MPCIIPFREFPQKRLWKTKNLSGLNPSWERLAELEGQLAQSVPEAPWGQGFSAGTGAYWKQGWEQEAVVKWDRNLFGDWMALYNLGLNKSTENNKPVP